MNIKYCIAGLAFLTVCGLTHASMSTDKGLGDKELRYAIAISIAQGYIAIMLDSPDAEVRQRAVDYSKYIDCLSKHQKPEISGISIFNAENCYLPPDPLRSEK
ncbi:hypothetical protein J7S78_13930 [Klebsiella oxytoca]|uniref:Lipoprotein n=1 Tax=Klebsiella oxytoca TaxID=571 RepID=A0AAP2BIL4_KLEOX|nr:hypothetical protein [Klebsiella oxytoca]MBQ0600893.1 hypothetical protein [Klebsiella oxytoca]